MQSVHDQSYCVGIETAAVGQVGHHKQEAGSAVARAKKAIISSFDPALPNLTLESFLHYETDGAMVEWKPFECAPERTHSLRNAAARTCIDISSDLDGSRTVDIVVAIPSETSGLPELLSVSMIENGLEHPLKLIELPVALHGRRYRTRIPRDVLPLQRVG